MASRLCGGRGRGRQVDEPLGLGDDHEQQRRCFAALRQAQEQLPIPLDTLSMGMSNDMEAAIAEGAHIVRVGTAIFGERNYIK